MKQSKRLIVAEASVDAALDAWFGSDFWREQRDSEIARRLMRRPRICSFGGHYARLRGRFAPAKFNSPGPCDGVARLPMTQQKFFDLIDPPSPLGGFGAAGERVAVDAAAAVRARRSALQRCRRLSFGFSTRSSAADSGTVASWSAAW
jgi:hypothetical protein